MQESRLSSWKENLERLILSLKGKDEDSAENIASSGGEGGECRSFRSGIFYFKLSNLVDLDLTAEIIRDIVGRIGTRKKNYATFFLNNSNNEIIHPNSMVKENDILATVRNYYEKYADENELYSGIIEQLFPEHGQYGDFHPGLQDLGVIITDRYGIEVAPSIEKDIRSMGGDWLLICADKHRPCELMKLKELVG